MANQFIQEVKNRTWKSLIPFGLLLSVCGGVFSILGLILLLFGLGDLLNKIKLSRFIRTMVLVILIIGLPYLVVTNLFIFFQVVLFVFLVICTIAIIKHVKV